MRRINELLKSLGQLAELARSQAVQQRRQPPQRPATYLGREGRSHKIRLPNGEIKYVAQRHVITRGALGVGAAVTLTDGMLDSLNSPYVQN